MDSSESRMKTREKQRLRAAYLMGKRARQFSPEEMIKQADQLISFARKFSKVKD